MLTMGQAKTLFRSHTAYSPFDRKAKYKTTPATTLPLEYFVDEWEDSPRLPVTGEKAQKPPVGNELTLLDYFSEDESS